ncbi:hypothetical protein OQA88_1496 [Cercophora sp. LCS_1]
MPTFISPTDSTPLFYRYHAPSTPKPLSIILLHGWPMSSRMFDTLIPSLLSQNHTLIAPDRRGFGNSHLFFMGNNGHIYRSSIPLSSFPGNFSTSITIIFNGAKNDFFEAI